MAHEWQIGDRFSLEAVITGDRDSNGDYRFMFVDILLALKGEEDVNISDKAMLEIMKNLEEE